MSTRCSPVLKSFKLISKTFLLKLKPKDFFGLQSDFNNLDVLEYSSFESIHKSNDLLLKDLMSLIVWYSFLSYSYVKSTIDRFLLMTEFFGLARTDISESGYRDFNSLNKGVIKIISPNLPI